MLLEVRKIYDITGSDGQTRRYSGLSKLTVYIPDFMAEYNGEIGEFIISKKYTKAITEYEGGKRHATIYNKNGDIVMDNIPVSINEMYCKDGWCILTDNGKYPKEMLLEIGLNKYIQLKEYNLIKDWIRLKKANLFPTKIDRSCFNAAFGNILIMKNYDYKLKIILRDENEEIQECKELEKVNDVYYRIINNNILNIIIIYKALKKEEPVQEEYYFSKQGEEYILQPKPENS